MTLEAAFFIDKLHGYVSNYETGILYTDDGGATWTVLPGITSNLILDMKFTSLYSGYIVGARGTIIKASDTAVFISLMTEDEEALLISPNPASGMAKISCTLRSRCEASITVYDASGKTMLNAGYGSRVDGKNEFLLSTEGMPSGMYFVNLKAGKQRFAGKLFVK